MTRDSALPVVNSPQSHSSVRPHTVDASGTGSESRTPKMPMMPAEGASGVVGSEESHKRGNKNDSESIVDIVALAKKHCLHLDEVRKLWDEFRTLDVKGRGSLSFEEFEQAVRKKCNLTQDEEIPSYLLEEQCKKIGIASWIKFEAYLCWAVATAFSEEVMVPDPAQRYLRKLARDYKVPFDDIEMLKALYDRYDEDGSGGIDLNEFRQVLIELHANNNAGVKSAGPNDKTIKRYFTEVDKDESGTVEFEEFLEWFLQSGL